jgi:hypothetical protein
MQYIKIHSLDNVAVALADLAEGTEVVVDGHEILLRQAVVRGHKFALQAIPKGRTSLSMVFLSAMRWRISPPVNIFILTIRVPI